MRIVSEVLLQRTKAETVSRYLPAFVARFPSWARLAAASESELEPLLKPLGLWRRRAVSLAGLARYAASVRGRFPSKRDDLEAVPAVGQYVANAILLFRHGLPAPLLDSGMARVLARAFRPATKADLRYDPVIQEAAGCSSAMRRPCA